MLIFAHRFSFPKLNLNFFIATQAINHNLYDQKEILTNLYNPTCIFAHKASDSNIVRLTRWVSDIRMPLAISNLSLYKHQILEQYSILQRSPAPGTIEVYPFMIPRTHTSN